MKGNIMLRLYPEMKAITQGKDKAVQAEHYAIGNFVHPKTGLMLKSEREGFFVEDGNFELGDVLSVREDFPVIVKVSFQEPSDHPAVVSVGCGTFVYKTTTIKISHRGGYPVGNLWISIISKSVSDFNEAVEALRDGGLKRAGSEQTLFQDMVQKVLELEKQLALAYECQTQLHNETAEAQNLLSERTQFLHGVDACLRLNREVPNGLKDSSVSERVVSSLVRIKNKSLWRRLWEVIFYPYSSVKKSKRRPGDDCLP